MSEVHEILGVRFWVENNWKKRNYTGKREAIYTLLHPRIDCNSGDLGIPFLLHFSWNPHWSLSSWIIDVLGFAVWINWKPWRDK